MCPKSSVALIEPKVELVTRSRNYVEVAISIEIANRRTMAFGVIQTLPGIEEISLSIVPPNGCLYIGSEYLTPESRDRKGEVPPEGARCLFSHQCVEITVGIQVGQEDGFD